MTYDQDTHQVKPSPLPGVDDRVGVTLTAQADRVVAMILAGNVPGDVAAECRRAHTSPRSLAAVLVAMHAHATRGADERFAFTGYLKDLVGPGRCYSVVRRSFKVARRTGLLEGVAADVYLDPESGRFARPKATYCQTLPRWAGPCRTWRRHREQTARHLEVPPDPSRALSQVMASVAHHRDVQTREGTVPERSVDSGDHWPRPPIPAHVRRQIEELTATRGRRRR